EPDELGRYVVEEWVDAVDLEQVLAWCLRAGQNLPRDVFLTLALEICEALEALHAVPATATEGDHVLHLALRPRAVQITRSGQVRLGEPGLLRSSASIPPAGLAARRTDHL